MSLSSWPPTGLDLSKHQKQSQQAAETKEQVFEALLDMYSKKLPAIMGVRSAEMTKWRNRFKAAQ